jgi:penicillin-binding protein 2
VYPPGSTFKMVTSMAGLEANVIKEDTKVFCPGHYDVGNHRFHCWKKGGHGTVDLTQALAQSCDTFYYSISRDIGIDRIAAMAKRLGLGEALGLELPEERKGTVPTQAWKEKTLGKKWDGGETVVASIGQGYLQTTPLQLATMVSRLVNGGKAVRPWMVAKLDGIDVGLQRQRWPDIGLPADHVARVRAGMEAVVNDERGTAHQYAIKDEARAFAGKTGTAQVRRITEQQRIEGMVPQEDQPWKYRHQGLFVGYAPKDNPRYVACVVVEHAGGSGPAASITRDILSTIQDMRVGDQPVRMPAPVPAPVPEKEKES